MRSHYSDRWKRRCTWGIAGCSLALSLVGVALNFDEKKLQTQPDFFQDSIRFLQEKSSWYILSATVGVGFFTLASMRYGDQKLWKLVHACLDEYRYLTAPSEAPDHLHRVTLFQHRTWLFCPRGFVLWNTPFWSGWLLPVERSGSRNTSTPVYFHAPTTNPHLAKGVAGRAWQSGNKTLLIKGLPDVRSETDVEGVQKYAAETNVSPDDVVNALRRRKQLPLSYFAINVELDGKLWGVIMVDSRDPELDNEDTLLRQFTFTAKQLDKLLREIERKEQT